MTNTREDGQVVKGLKMDMILMTSSEGNNSRDWLIQASCFGMTISASASEVYSAFGPGLPFNRTR